MSNSELRDAPLQYTTRNGITVRQDQEDKTGAANGTAVDRGPWYRLQSSSQSYAGLTLVLHQHVKE